MTPHFRRALTAMVKTREGDGKMTKDKITLDAVKEDLCRVVEHRMSNRSDARINRILPGILFAIALGIFLKSFIIGLLASSFSVYHIICAVNEYREYKESKNAVLSLIERGDISISKETLSHIVNEEIYEPHTSNSPFAGRRAVLTKTVTVYHFEGGTSWRMPNFREHYSWSREHYISCAGLENISLQGDEFYFVSLQGHYSIAYIYPCKFFDLDKSIE